MALKKFVVNGDVAGLVDMSPEEESAHVAEQAANFEKRKDRKPLVDLLDRIEKLEKRLENNGTRI